MLCLMDSSTRYLWNTYGGRVENTQKLFFELGGLCLVSKVRINVHANDHILILIHRNEQ